MIDNEYPLNDPRFAPPREDNINALVAEVERLRAERDHFREAWAAAQVRLDCGVDAADAVREELADVVAWLRKWGGDCDDAAETIERGEHRREEEP